MNAEFGIDDEGRPYLAVTVSTEHELSVLERMRPWLQLQKQPLVGEYRITGDRLPGMGNLTSQDATGKVAP